MRRIVVAILVTLIMALGQNNPAILQESHTSNASASDLILSFTNGPSEGDTVKGLYTVSFSSTGSGTISSIILEISDDGSDWISVTNITSTPWLSHVDTTQFANGTWTFRAMAWDSVAENNTTWFSSGEFTIANQAPVITSFALTNSGVGSGETAIDRAWYYLESNGTLSFTWTAIDDDLSYASLANVPGPSSPSDDGPDDISYGWDWASGSMAEGTYNPRLSVWDNSGLKDTQSMFIGIDRTAPTISTPTIGGATGWSSDTNVLISDLDTSVDDGSGSGVSHVQIMQDGEWTNVSTSSTTLSFDEGEHTISIRPIDRVGNIGSSIEVDIKVDTTEPESGDWTVDELTTSLIGAINISLTAEDLGSGIDYSSTQIQYGFDLNGVGNTPDQSGRWIDIGTTGLSGTIGLSSWATKSQQYLMLRAVIVDNASNEITTIPRSFQILPGLDLSWNATQTNIDRLVVRPGDNNGNVTITSLLESNQAYLGSVTIQLEAAPADRTADVDWIVMETRVLEIGSLSDLQEELIWNYTVPNTGQWDIRLTIDSTESIDERDEGNNQFHLVVTGATISGIGTVSSFAPSIIALLGVGFVITWYQRRKLTLPPK